jgi:hypothetical protein
MWAEEQLHNGVGCATPIACSVRFPGGDSKHHGAGVRTPIARPMWLELCHAQNSGYSKGISDERTKKTPSRAYRLPSFSATWREARTGM